jgi:hypothetical protein
MSVLRFAAGPAVFFMFTAVNGHLMYAQGGIEQDRIASIRARVSQTEKTLDALPDAQQKGLSSGAQSLLKIAQGWKEIEAGLEKAASHQSQAQKFQAQIQANAAEQAEATAFVSRVSNPSTDFLFSMMGGFTQSETSTAWCGNNVVIGFNDSGSFIESMLLGPGGSSLTGASVSASPRGPFRDVGYINPGPNPADLLAGDPVVTCTVAPASGGQSAATTFYYSQLYQTGSATTPVSAIAVSRSTDGGATWQDPVAAVQKDGKTHFLDKDWSATDPTNPGTLLITYTDFDSSGDVCGLDPTGAPVPRSAIEMVRSTDGGASWTSPSVLAESCAARSGFPYVQGSQVLVDSKGTVYVAWEILAGATGTTRVLWIRRSTDHGASFAGPVKIDNVVETGDGHLLQGTFRNNEYPMLAADRNSGILYVTWNDGRNFALPDLAAPDAAYHYADILISRSTDGGATWSPAVRVNADPLTHFFRGQSRGTDHYMPGVAVDGTGAVGVCWYDRRSDPANLTSTRFCSISGDGGATWGNNVLSAIPSSPWHATDIYTDANYMGDYDALASDSTGANPGFLGAYGIVTLSGLVPNQDVASISFP